MFCPAIAPSPQWMRRLRHRCRRRLRWCGAPRRGEIYTLALPFADTLCLTEIDAEVPGDVRFPSFDRRQWEETERSARMCVGPLAYTYVTWRRTTPPAPAKAF